MTMTMRNLEKPMETADSLEKLDLEKVIQCRIENIKASIGHTDRYRHFVLDEKWAKARQAMLLESGVSKLQTMYNKAREMGYSFTLLSAQSSGLIFFHANRENTKLGGYLDPCGKLVMGLENSRLPVLKISLRRRLRYHDTFLYAILKEKGLRK